MALEYLSSPGTWTAYTAGTTVLPHGARVLNFRDTAVAISGASPGGAGVTATISLPAPARLAIFAATASNASTTLTAGVLALRWIPKSSSFAVSNTEPQPAGATASGIDAVVQLTGTSENSSFGISTAVPMDFQIRANGLTYGGTLTLLTIQVEVILY